MSVTQEQLRQFYSARRFITAKEYQAVGYRPFSALHEVNGKHGVIDLILEGRQVLSLDELRERMPMNLDIDRVWNNHKEICDDLGKRIDAFRAQWEAKQRK